MEHAEIDQPYMVILSIKKHIQGTWNQPTQDKQVLQTIQKKTYRNKTVMLMPMVQATIFVGVK